MDNTTASTITAQELRIGNWLLYNPPEPSKIDAIYGRKKEPSKNIKVESIGENGINVDILDYGEDGVFLDWEYLTNFEPIPLTPEILEKAGFTLNKPYWEKEYKMNGLRLQELVPSVDDRIQYGVVDNDNVYISFNLFYAHQLQNLYFALTGDELPLSL